MKNRSAPPPVSPLSLARAVVSGVGPERELGLFLDYDGSLVSIRPTPGAARADEELLGLLRGLAATPRVRVAVATGRSLASLAEVLPPVPGVMRFGDHGASGLDPVSGEFSLLEPEKGPISAPEPLYRAIDGETWPEGVWVERKPWSVAVHTRSADDSGREEVAVRLRTLVDADGRAEILAGKEILEVRPRGLHKGLAMDWFKRRLVPPDRHRVVCVGDDRTDEDAFRALGPGDVAVLVAEEPRASAAGHRLRSPRAVREFLAELRRMMMAGTEA